MIYKSWIAVLLTAIGLLSMPMLISVASETYNETEPSMDIIVFSDVPVLFLSSSDNYEKYQERMERGTSKTMVTSYLNVDTLKEIQAIFIDESWMKSNWNDITKKDLKAELIDSIPIVIFTNDTEKIVEMATELDIGYSFANSADVRGIYYDAITDSTHCYSMETEEKTTDRVVGCAYNWATTIKTILIDNPSYYGHGGKVKTTISPATTPGMFKMSLQGGGSGWGNAVYISDDSYLTNYGWQATRTAVFKLQNDGCTPYNFYQVDFLLQSIPNSGRATGDMVIKGAVQYHPIHGPHQTLYRYNPTTTSGSSSTSVNLGFSYNADSGATASVSCGWTYNTVDAPVNDGSSFPTNKFDWWINVDEGKNVGHYTYYIEPGAIIKVDAQNNDGKYYWLNDEYSVNFCKCTLWFHTDYLKNYRSQTGVCG